MPITAAGKPEAGAVPRPFVRSPFDERDGRFSPNPNSRYVAYTSDESGRHEVYIQAFPEPRGKWQISMGGGISPEWGPSGQELFYLSPGNKLMVVKLKLEADFVETSPPRELFAVAESTLGGFRVASDGKRFLVRVPVESGARPLTVTVNWPALLKRAPASR